MIKNADVVSSFLAGAAELLNTSRQFSDIYRKIINDNRKNVYAEFFNLNIINIKRWTKTLSVLLHT